MKIQDQTGAWLCLEKPPKRIVSLVPSISELLVHLGFEQELIGVTQFCSHPHYLRKAKTTIGGTKNPDLPKIANLKPDLVIANKEENLKEHVESIRAQFPVYVSDVKSLTDNLRLISDLGQILDCTSKSTEMCTVTQHGFEKIKNIARGSFLYLIWQDPVMAAGKDTIIDFVLEHSGFSNCVKQGRYPKLGDEDIKTLKPDYIFLSSEPYPFKEKNRDSWAKKFPNSKVILVDGRAFSWYGYCFQQTPKYIQNLWSEIQM